LSPRVAAAIEAAGATCGGFADVFGRPDDRGVQPS
jgi:hypothetical protein